MSGKIYKSFKDYIEKRTVEDIMADYGEQRDEWKEISVSKTDGKDNTSSETKNDDA